MLAFYICRCRFSTLVFSMLPNPALQMPPLVAASAVPHLPHDLLLSIAEFLQGRTLSHVCRRLWAALRYRYVCPTTAKAPAILDMLPAIRDHVRMFRHHYCNHALLHALGLLQGSPHLSELSLTVYGDCPRPVSNVAAIVSSCPLQTLRLHFRRPSPSSPATEVFAALGTATRLRHLSLSFSCGLGYEDVQLLGRLSALPHLAHVGLLFIGGAVSGPWAQHVARLGLAPALTSLKVQLCTPRAGPGEHDAIVRAFAALRAAPVLADLRLHFRGMAGVTDAGACALAALAGVRRLRALRLALHGTRTSARALHTLTAAFAAAPALQDMALDVSESVGVTPGPAPGAGPSGFERGFAALRAVTLSLEGGTCDLRTLEGLCRLKSLPTLRFLSVNLEHNRLESGHVTALASVVRSAASVTELTLYLCRCGLTDAHLLAIADGLRRCRELRDFHLFASGNGLTDRGVGRLSEAVASLPGVVSLGFLLDQNECEGFGLQPLGRCRRLTSLFLWMAETRLTDAGLQSLCLVRHAPCLREVELKVAATPSATQLERLNVFEEVPMVSFRLMT